jgi:hypothetical protein
MFRESEDFESVDDSVDDGFVLLSEADDAWRRLLIWPYDGYFKIYSPCAELPFETLGVNVTALSDKSRCRVSFNDEAAQRPQMVDMSIDSVD